MQQGVALQNDYRWHTALLCWTFTLHQCILAKWNRVRNEHLQQPCGIAWMFMAAWKAAENLPRCVALNMSAWCSMASLLHPANVTGTLCYWLFTKFLFFTAKGYRPFLRRFFAIGWKNLSEWRRTNCSARSVMSYATTRKKCNTLQNKRQGYLTLQQKFDMLLDYSD